MDLRVGETPGRGHPNVCPSQMARGAREISAQELGALLSGIDLSQAHRPEAYQRKSSEAAIKHDLPYDVYLAGRPVRLTIFKKCSI